jgi:hypothetical protein
VRRKTESNDNGGESRQAAVPDGQTVHNGRTKDEAQFAISPIVCLFSAHTAQQQQFSVSSQPGIARTLPSAAPRRNGGAAVVLDSIFLVSSGVLALAGSNGKTPA